ncbi:MAG: glycosyltransferase family 4 protein [Gemmatimonadales bacterium]
MFVYNIASNFPLGGGLVVTGPAVPGSAALSQDHRIPIVRLGYSFVPGPSRLREAWALVRLLRDLISIVRREKIDLVHAGFIRLDGVAAYVLWRACGVPYVQYLYGEELTGLLRQTERRGGLMRAIFRRVIRNAAGFITVSDFTTSLLPRFGRAPGDAVKIVPPVSGVVLKVGNPDGLRDRYALPRTRRVILIAGRLIERKGHDNLIRAMPTILRSVLDAHLLVVGRGPDLHRLQAIAESAGVRDRVTFAGFVPDESLGALYELCDVLALPHRQLSNGDTEGCPTVFLEANAHGKPVVGGMAGGVRDAIVEGETGLIVDGDDVAAIAGAIAKLLQDSALASRLGSNGRRRVEGLTPAAASARAWEFSEALLGAASQA